MSTGAQNDLSQATHIVRKMITEYGMSEKLGPVALGTGAEEVFLGRDLLKERNYSEELAYEVDKEVSRIIEESYQRAYHILEKNKDKLIKLAEELEAKEVLEEADIKRILGDKIAAEDERKQVQISEEKVKEKKVEEKKTEEKVERGRVKNILPGSTLEGEARG